MITNAQAINYLYPDAAFSIVNDDLSTVVWRTDGITTPTKKQITDAIKAMEEEEAQAIANKEAAKASAEAKLAALGLTVEELQAIIK